MSLSSSELKASIIEYDSNASVQKSMDRLQTAWQCCGFDSYQDYEFNNLFKCSAKGERACGVPPSCCITIEGHFPKLSCGYNVRRNLTMDPQASSYVYTEGCTPHLRSLLVLRLDIVGMVGLGSSIPQIIGFLLGYYFIRRVEEYHVWYRVGAIGSSMSTSS
ncbi:unnamed protein product [Acanthosepion pharaonis]|uniref:Uncharacterized protein n=1 Tax=Acanthosepion pharaonis TaxID=158019 RepID=A0A812BAT1_ACAPH|nr:unnamed protein product [Sepia pharaonis]